MGMDSFLVASSTLLICAQRLVRALCPHCKKVSEYDKKAFLSVGFTEEEVASPDFEIFEPVGCNRCTTPVLPGEHWRAGRWRHLGMWSVYCGINPTDLDPKKSPAVEFSQDLVDRILGRATDYMI